MARKIDWLNHSLEFIVVLIGILIAFQLNTCADNRSKKNLIKNHLNYIEIECEANKDRLAAGITHIEEQLQNCDSLLQAISTSQNIAKIRGLSTKLLDMRNVDLTHSAYQVLSQSGDIRYIKDFELKRNIITMYDSFDLVDQINRTNKNLYDTHFYPYLKNNFDLVNWNYVKVNSKEEEQKYYAREFANTVSTYRFLLMSKLRVYQKELNMIDEYLAQ